MSSINVNKIVEKLTQADNAYYNNSKSILTDKEYDELRDKLKYFEPENSYFESIGIPIESSIWKKANHKIPMGSLNKVNTEVEFQKWCMGMTTNEFSIEEKLDGISINLEYKNGTLQKAISRGDGFRGENILSNVVQMQNVNEKIGKFTGSIRGEIILLSEDFEKINKLCRMEGIKEFKNPRNSASGIAKKSTGKFSEYLTILYYDVVASHINFKTETDKIKFIQSELHLQTAMHQKVDMKKAMKIYTEYEDGIRAKINYDIDGLVIKVDSLESQKNLGELNKKPKGQIAWKFESMKVNTNVRDIEWSIGKNRRITPVAILEPVNVGGVVVKRATMHNYEIFTKTGLYMNAKVQISRRGDVIPAIEKIIEDKNIKNKELFQPITMCPVCSKKLTVKDKYLICTNDNCDALYLGNLHKWIKKLEIKDVGESTIESLYYANKLKNPSDFYLLKITDIANLDRLGEKSAKKIIAHLNQKKEIHLSTFIGGLNIDGFGATLAGNLISSGYHTLKDLLNLKESDIVKVKGFEIKTARLIVKGLKEKKNVIGDLLNVGIKIVEPEIREEKSMEGILKGLSFCFTGKIEKLDNDGKRYTRKMLEGVVYANGGETMSSVKKGLTYLVLANPDSTSTKTKKALSLGITLLSESEFFEMV